VFDALPIPDGEGRVVANLFEPRGRRATTGSNATYGSGNRQPEPADRTTRSILMLRQTALKAKRHYKPVSVQRHHDFVASLGCLSAVEQRAFTM
jgi:hypothetical protein